VESGAKNIEIAVLRRNQQLEIMKPAQIEGTHNIKMVDVYIDVYCVRFYECFHVHVCVYVCVCVCVYMCVYACVMYVCVCVLQRLWKS